MTPRVSSELFEQFFAWAPWVIGLAIYLSFYVAKRREVAVVPAAAGAQQTFACDVCGRRGARGQMIQQDHGGAIGYRCASHAGEVSARS